MYRNYFKGDNLDFTVLVWADALVDDEAKYIMRAAKDYIKTDASGFPPSIGQLRAIAKEIKRKDYVDTMANMMLGEPDPEPMTDEQIAEREKMWAEAKRICGGGIKWTKKEEIF